MNTLSAGFSRVNVNPMLGIAITGYYKPRYAEGILDDLEINALALACGDDKVVLLSVDYCELSREVAADYRQSVSEATGLPVDAVYIHTTHTHTGPAVRKDSADPLISEYTQTVSRKMADAAVMALADLKPAKMGWGIGDAPNIAFVRRFRMTDGTIKTNPGVNNPEIVAPVGDVDERVSVVRFDREGAESIVLVNFANHPDVVGGSLISADWPGFLRKTVEKTLDNTRCIFFNGTQGDVNHVNVHPTGGFLNDTFNDFDDVSRGYGHARYMGRVVAGGVLQVFDKVKYVDVDTIAFKKRSIKLPSNMPTAEQLPEAHRISGLHRAGRDSELPYQGMMLTTVVAEAERMVELENGPEFFDMDINGIRIGEIVLIGIPGEPFTGIGRGIKDTEGFELIMPTCLTNGSQGYFPMRECYAEGGYEAKSSPFKEGVAEIILDEAKALIAELGD